MKALAERLGVSLASASRAVEGLVKRGLVTRVEDADDRRVRSALADRRGPTACRAQSSPPASRASSASPPASRRAERERLESALELLLERDEIAAIYRHIPEGEPPMTRYRHLITDDNRKWWTLGAMCFALFMVMLDNTVVNVALPSIQRDLDSDLGELEWIVNGYTLTFAVLIATGGRLGDIFGRRRMFLLGVDLRA